MIQKGKLNFWEKSLVGVTIFISSLFLFNCSTHPKNQETTMSSTPNRGIAGANCYHSPSNSWVKEGSVYMKSVCANGEWVFSIASEACGKGYAPCGKG